MTDLAIITGAGSGLGRALAIELTGQGLTVAGFGRREGALQETATLAGETFLALPCDVSDPGAVAATFAHLNATHGPTRILIANAAVYPRADILDHQTRDLLHAIDINLGGTIACVKAALTTMVPEGRGRILLVSSFADIAPLPASAAYAVSKGAQRIFARALHADLGDRLPGIVTTTWMPGMLATGMGLPEGLPPGTAAKWGAALALWDNPSLNGTTFERNLEVLPPKGLKSRIKDRLMGRRSVPRTIPPLPPRGQGQPR